MSPEKPYLGRGCGSPYSKRELVERELWSLVEHTVFRWSFRSWHGFRARLLTWFGAEIPRPDQVVIFPSARISFPRNLRMAPRSMVAPRVRLYNLALIDLQYGANLSQDCHLCAGTHDYHRWSMPLIARPITIGPNAWLGAEGFVGPGVSVGELCVVGARSVVVKDLPANTICVGNPCRPVRERTAPAE
jgi:putative colanic acid biosynthesis acetyltransferase WcaF